MKQYPDKCKADTRSGGRAMLAKAWRLALLACCALFVQCHYRHSIDPSPSEDSYVYQCGFDCVIDGEPHGFQVGDYYSPRIYSRDPEPDSGPFAFTGFKYITNEDGSQGVTFDYSSFGFCLHLMPLNYKEYPNVGTLFFYIKGDGVGPFVTGKDYSSPENVAAYYPNWHFNSSLRYGRDYYGYKMMMMDYPPDMKGLKVNLLSSSFKFEYSQVEIDEVSVPLDVLDFYFDFEEVITQTPEGCSSPAVGDTIKVSDGHFQQVISLYNYRLKDLIQECIKPQ